MKNSSTKAEITTSSLPIGNTDVSCRLSFYKQPFRRPKYGSWVYDANENFVFQFETKFNDKGDYAEGEKELQAAVINSINAENHQPIKELNLSVDKDDENCILNNDAEFIIIRGWGNLTGVGANNFPAEKAAKIQDDFRDWLIRKLSENGS
jgi:hypothetical protein